MTTAEKNAAIAEACGWTSIKPGLMYSWELRGLSPNGDRSVIPDFCNDLNAMHEAEMNYKWIEVCSRLDYVQMLEKIMGFKYGATLFATAQQRADAFLCTIGKWVD